LQKRKAESFHKVKGPSEKSKGPVGITVKKRGDH